MSKILYLMRHGQTMFNLRGKVQGASDSPLTKLEYLKRSKQVITLNIIILLLTKHIHLVRNEHVIR